MSDLYSGFLQLSTQEHSLAFVAELAFPKALSCYIAGFVFVFFFDPASSQQHISGGGGGVYRKKNKPLYHS